MGEFLADPPKPVLYLLSVRTLHWRIYYIGGFITQSLRGLT